MITNTTAKSVYTIASGVTTYAIGFSYQYNPDNTPQINVYIKPHPETPLIYGTDYTISADGLSIELVSGYEVGDKLVILRAIPMVQLSDYVIGRIDPEQIEADFDEAVMRDQQLEAEIDLLEEMPIDHEARLVAIEEVIPDEATPSNQLTDKNYVDTLVSNHTNRTDNPHSVTAAQVGLGNCDNTSDLNKPISTATQNALDLKANSANLAAVATSGSYADLSNTPTLGTMAAESANDYTKTASLSTVATSGSYSDLNNTPTLGTAAAAATTDFATAAQGTKADTAVQPGDLATVATSGSYADLSSTPSIPTVINDMSDVDTASVQDGEFLRYDAVAGKWSNAASSASIGFSGITGSPYDNTLLGKELNIKTNCITEIPQDIKLELNAGTLTLKAGSKVYNGNGLILTTDSDKTLYQAYDNTNNMLLIWKLSTSNLQTGVSGETVSSLPSPTTSYKVFYNTTDGKCYFDDGQMSECSFPLALVSRTTSGFTSINQVFNGFGYIGCTRFALPGNKWLSPDGRNADGTLKSVLRTNTSVLIETLATPGIEVVNVLGTGSLWTSGKYIESEDEPTGNYIIWYKPSENILRDKAEGNWTINNNIVVCGFFDNSTGTNITNLYIRQPFCAVDNSDLIFLLNTLYPVGSIYLGTQSACPLATLIPGSTWTKVTGRYLLASGTLAGTSETYSATNTVAAGLPNVSGSLRVRGTGSNAMSINSETSGAFSMVDTGQAGGFENTGSYNSGRADFYSSNSNSTYGQSATVRTPAYVVNVWRRTA